MPLSWFLLHDTKALLRTWHSKQQLVSELTQTITHALSELHIVLQMFSDICIIISSIYNNIIYSS